MNDYITWYLRTGFFTAAYICLGTWDDRKFMPYYTAFIAFYFFCWPVFVILCGYGISIRVWRKINGSKTHPDG